VKTELLGTALSLFQQARRPIWFPMVGTSMSPQIKEGDMILVQPAQSSIRFGDVIVFKQRGGLIAHRVISIQKGSNEHIYRTKGDNRRDFDALVMQSEVLGRVVCIQRHNRTICLKKPPRQLFSLSVTLFSCAIGHLYQAVKKFRASVQ
jgi:signal peptidase I